MTFESLTIIEPLLKALNDAGYQNPTPIQTQAIPPLLMGKDLLGCAQTGTGKTAAFALPILQNMHAQYALNPNSVRRRGAPRALILTPTRELAEQIARSFSDYGKYLRLSCTVLYGGVSEVPQIKALGDGVDILVATPGRLIDLLDRKYVDLSHVGCFVLDEADRMLDMGFLRDVERIIKQLPEKRQTMLFSATMPEEIEKLTRTLLHQPIKVKVTPEVVTVDSIEQSLYFVNKANKSKLLIFLLKNPEIVSALVFTRTKHRANRLVEELRHAGETCEVIHANKAQSARRLALSQFKSGQSRILVATDIVSRGIDIVELSHVFNFNLPEAPEDYVHRIGRTGRAGLGGKAISFCDNSEIKYLETIEKHIGKKITVIEGHPYPLQYAPEELVSKKPEQSNFMNRRPRSPGNSVGQKPRERKQTEYGQRKQQKKR